MKLLNCNTRKDLIEYIGKSKSWQKALRASKRKWYEHMGSPGDLCGFCDVSYNITKAMICGTCPVSKFCHGRTTPSTYKLDNGDTLKFLNSTTLKNLIDNSSIGYKFNSKEQL